MKAFFSFWLALTVASFGVWAGAVYTNDTGQAVYGIRVEFAEAVKIASHAEIFPIQSPEGAASAFIFSGGEALPGETFWLSWSSASVRVLQYEWLTEATGPAAGIAAVSSDVLEQHIVQDEYKVQFVDADGQSIEVGVLREKSREAIPFTVSYHLEFPDAYKVVAIVDAPGLFSFPDKDGDLASVVVPTLKIDDFNDTDKVSELGTTWTFQHTDPQIDAFEVAKTAFGYGLMFNGNNGVALSLYGVNADDFEGLYLVITGSGVIDWGIGIRQLSVGLDGWSYPLYSLPVMLRPVLYKIPFPAHLELGSLFDLKLALDVDSHPWGGITLYDIGFYMSLDKIVENASADTFFDFNFLFDTNSTEHNIRLLLVDDSGKLFTYQESIDFPLHNETEILLDATQVFAEDPVASVTWNLSNVDPTEDVDLNGIQVSYQSEWPDVRDIVVKASTQDGETLEKRFYSLIYWKDGCPIPVRGFQANNAFVSPAYFEASRQRFELAKELGYNMMSREIFWYYNWPDENGNFTLEQRVCDNSRGILAEGCCLSDEGLKKFLTLAKEFGFITKIQIIQSPYNNDPELRSNYPAWGTTPDGRCFRCEDEFLYGNGEGYWNQLMHYKELFTRLGVDIAVFGAEADSMFRYPGSKVREFYSDVIKEWEAFPGMVTYAVIDCTPSDWSGYSALNPFSNEQALNPYVSVVPFGEMDLVTLNEYQVLATKQDSSTAEMRGRAIERIGDYMQRFHEAYGKPLLVNDLVVAAYKGVLLDPPGEWEEIMNKPRDDLSQLKYYKAWLQAFSYAIRDLGYDWIYGVTIGSFQMNPDEIYLGENHLGGSQSLNAFTLNLKPRLLDTFKVYLSDKPIED